MTSYLAPFPDELLTSWIARRSHGRKEFPDPGASVAERRQGQWFTADILPAHEWLDSWAQQYDVPRTDLRAAAFAERYPGFPLDLIAWRCSPFETDPFLQGPPRFRLSWCSRCLAEDFAVGRPAYFRQHWALATMGFCPKHGWPMEDFCVLCDSYRWALRAPRRGPLRLMCQDCWRPLERSRPACLAVESTQRSWAPVISFEQQLQRAAEGRVPDQCRFNCTSALQLLNVTRDVCGVLVYSDERWPVRDRLINNFVSPDLNPGQRRTYSLSWPLPQPLTMVSSALRRSLLAAAAAIIDPRDEVNQALFGDDAEPAIEIFVYAAGDRALERYRAMPDRWPPSFYQRVFALHKRPRHFAMFNRLRRRINAYQKISESAARWEALPDMASQPEWPRKVRRKATNPHGEPEAGHSADAVQTRLF